MYIVFGQHESHQRNSRKNIITTKLFVKQMNGIFQITSKLTVFYIMSANLISFSNTFAKKCQFAMF